MPARVAPLMMAPVTITTTHDVDKLSTARAPPPSAPTASSSTSSSSSAFFLDTVMDAVCCAAESNNANIRRRGRERLTTVPTAVVRRRERSRSERPPTTTTKPSSLENVILPRLRFRPLTSQQQQQPQASSSSTTETTSAPARSSSSLHEFFDLFLADDAPHSFKSFHESNGDEDVRATPWKTTTCCASSGEDPLDENTSPTENYDRRRVEESGRMERTITFQTNIAPGSSNSNSNSNYSNLLSSQSSDSNSNNNSNNGNSNGGAAIPLRVIIVQTLSRRDRDWILECEFSFDFTTSSTAKSSLDISAGRRLGSGLGQYLMGNFVKGSTVGVSVTLSEEMGEDDGESSQQGEGLPPRLPRKKKGGESTSGGGRVRSADEGRPLSCLGRPLPTPPDGLCGGGTSSAPSSSPIGSNNNNNKRGGLRQSDSGRNGRPSPEEEEAGPSKKSQQQLGASFLAATENLRPASSGDENVPEAEEEEDTSAWNRWLEAVACWTPDSGSWFEEHGTTEEEPEREWRGPEDGDTAPSLRRGGPSTSSDPGRGATSPSGDSSPTTATRVPRTPSEGSVRVAPPSTPADGRGGRRRAPGAPGRLPSTPDTPGILLDSSSPSTTKTTTAPDRGLSLRIEMEVNPSRRNSFQRVASDSNNSDPNNNNTTAGSGSLLRTRPLSRPPSYSSSLGASIASAVVAAGTAGGGASLDERVRRGLKKRVARSWIAWAEGWCSKRWEEERRSALGGATARDRGTRGAGRGTGGKSKANDRDDSSEVRHDERRWRRLRVDHRDPSDGDNGSGRYVDRSVWMNTDGEDERGVEVACTIVSPCCSTDGPTTIQRSVSSSSSMATTDANGGGARRGRRSSSKRRLSLLKRGG